jgi:uncharacterized SAM-binding protein YcdF (DUF218 family)
MAEIDDDLTQTQRKLGGLLWHFLRVEDKLRVADCIMVLGGHDPGVAKRAEEIYKSNWARKVLVTGGDANVPEDSRGKLGPTEADVIAGLLESNGVRNEDLIVERKATNTSENFWFTERLLKELGLGLRSFILVTKPYAEKRTLATACNRWPDKEFIVGGSPITYEDYLRCGIRVRKIISMMVGEVQRLRSYVGQGFIVPVTIPSEVQKAADELLALGFDERRID